MLFECSVPVPKYLKKGSTCPYEETGPSVGLSKLFVMLWAMVWLSPVHTLNRPDLLINVVSAFILVTSDMISGKLK